MRHAVSIAAFLLAGCVPTMPRIYMPLEKASVSETGRMCEANFKTEVYAKNGVVIRLVLLPRSDKFVGSLQVDVAAGISARFQSGDLRFSGVGQTPVRVALGDGRYRASDELRGYAVAEFPFALALPSSPQEIVMHLPTMEVNGTLVPFSPIPFGLRRQAMLVGLCQ